MGGQCMQHRVTELAAEACVNIESVSPWSFHSMFLGCKYKASGRRTQQCTPIMIPHVSAAWSA